MIEISNTGEDRTFVYAPMAVIKPPQIHRKINF